MQQRPVWLGMGDAARQALMRPGGELLRYL
ncbi:hypothetical protein RCH06_003576 [Polaromonas sp. CG_9.5]|nr:hypothetical protein [Polaromonas sp. CG_9.5]